VTKALSGHGDAIGGVVLGRKPRVARVRDLSEHDAIETRLPSLGSSPPRISGKTYWASSAPRLAQAPYRRIVHRSSHLPWPRRRGVL